MATSAEQAGASSTEAPDALNEVRIRGRVSRPPEERVLPSGDVVWTFRVVVRRSPDRTGSKQTVDALECAAWSPRARRSVAAWSADDLVEVCGAVRRRFFRAGGAASSRVEIEMVSGRRVRRAGSA